MKLTPFELAELRADARAINDILQTMGNTREQAGISC